MAARLIPFLIVTLFLPTWATAQADPSSLDQDPETRWQAPPPVDETARVLKFTLQAAYQRDRVLAGEAFSMLDLSVKRKLDENSILAEGWVRLRKSLSTSDPADRVDLRLARLSYLEPWFQATLGRFDLFQHLTPNLFFGGYPVMGLRRVDGVLATLPFSFLFKLGDPKDEAVRSSPPLAASFFYTPSLFSAQQVQSDFTQAFWLAQLRARIEEQDLAVSARVNAGKSSSPFFVYSSLNGDWTGSASLEIAYQGNASLTAEVGFQNLAKPTETGALALGFQASRLGTWGAFSFDQVALEAQFPLGTSLGNPFTAWYAKVRARLKALFFEVHATNSRDDYTFARPSASSLLLPFEEPFGPGQETDGPGTALTSKSYEDIAFLVRTGVEF
jgi:hypothetical protein